MRRSRKKGKGKGDVSHDGEASPRSKATAARSGKAPKLAKAFRQRMAAHNRHTDTFLDLRYCQMRVAEAEALAMELPHMTRLTKLDLSNNGISDRGLSLLADALHNHPALVAVDLSFNGLTTNCIRPLESLLRRNLTLQHILVDEGKVKLLVDDEPGWDMLNDRRAKVDAMLEQNKLVQSCLHRGANSLPLRDRFCRGDPLPGVLWKLHSLTALDLAHNGITELPPEVAQLTALTHLNVEHNALASLPDTIAGLTALNHLQLSENRLTTLSTSLCRLPLLRVLDVSSNRLSELPPQLGHLTTVEELYLSNNELTALPDTTAFMQCLVKLDIQNNGVHSLPPDVPQLERLQFLNVLGNPLRNVPSSLAQRPSDVIAYLRELAKDPRPAYQTKVVLCGNENVGKTTLSKCLRNIKPEGNTATDGIDISSYTYGEGSDQPVITFSLWDFAGQDLYYSTHQFFLSDRTMYVYVFDLRKSLVENKMEYWLRNVDARAPQCPIFVVGTHRDDPNLTDEAVNAIFQDVYARFHGTFNIQAPFHSTDGHVHGDGVAILKSFLWQDACQRSYVTENIPASYFLLQTKIGALRSLRQPPVIPLTELQTLAAPLGLDGDALLVAMRFMHDQGHLLHYDDKEAGLDTVVVLDPAWLIGAFACIFSLKNTFAQATGVLRMDDLPQLWRAPQHPPHLHQVMIALLMRFEVAFQISVSKALTAELLLPALLPPPREDRFDGGWPVFEAGVKMLGRVYSFSFLPLGFMARLTVRLLHFMEASEHYSTDLIVVHFDNLIHLTMDPDAYELRLTVAGTHPAQSMQLVVELVDALVRDWYKVEFAILVPCYHCMESRAERIEMWPLTHCETAVAGGVQTLTCGAGDEPVSVSLERLVPDVSLKDLEPFKVSFDQIQMGKYLGEGAFAEVFLAKLEGDNVAVKKLFGMDNPRPDKEFNFSAAFNEFRRELWIMANLMHPNLCRLRGLCMRPMCIVTEFVGHGDLYAFIHDEEQGLGWPLVVKIAIDIAAGMTFLHSRSPCIIHRDLKTPNVLMAAVTPDAEVVAKVADFGLSRMLGPAFEGRQVDNPVWLAPEVLRGQPYDEKVDVYAFGVMLWELVTRKDFFGDAGFMFQVEQDIMDGARCPIPESVHPSFAKLIEACWDDNPRKRPSFASALTRLWRIAQADDVVMAAVNVEHALPLISVRGSSRTSAASASFSAPDAGWASPKSKLDTAASADRLRLGPNFRLGAKSTLPMEEVQRLRTQTRRDTSAAPIRSRAGAGRRAGTVLRVAAHSVDAMLRTQAAAGSRRNSQELKVRQNVLLHMRRYGVQAMDVGLDGNEPEASSGSVGANAAGSVPTLDAARTLPPPPLPMLATRALPPPPISLAAASTDGVEEGVS